MARLGRLARLAALQQHQAAAGEACCAGWAPAAGAAPHALHPRHFMASAAGSTGSGDAAAAAAAAAAAGRQQQQWRHASGGPAAAARPPKQPGGGSSGGAEAKGEPSVHSGLGVDRLPEVPPARYFDVPDKACPEAAAEYYRDPVLKEENVNEPNYGCRGTQREWAFSRRRALLARPPLHRLLAAAAKAGAPGADAGRRIYLDGWTGSGKSVALFSLVAWARANGWLALYIPSAVMLIRGGLYSKGADGLWDTPVAARHILTAATDNHAALLADLKTPAGKPLADIVAEGLAAGASHAAVVAAALELRQAVAGVTEVPTLQAVDDYNAMFAYTRYFEPMHQFHRRPVAPDELRLVREFRVMEQAPPARGLAVAAPTFGADITPRLRIPRPPSSRMHFPRYSLPEVEAVATHFAERGRIPGVPPEGVLRRALFLTNGNAKELRESSAVLLEGDDPLGLSLGYKTQAALVAKYLTGQL